MASDLNYKKTTKPKYSKLGFFMAIIPLTGFAIFGLLPLLLSVVVSFFKPVGYRFPGMSFVGWDNYARVLRDPLFLKSIGNTLYAMLSIPVTLVLSLLIATILSNPKSREKRFSDDLLHPPCFFDRRRVADVEMDSGWGIRNRKSPSVIFRGQGSRLAWRFPHLHAGDDRDGGLGQSRFLRDLVQRRPDQCRPSTLRGRRNRRRRAFHEIRENNHARDFAGDVLLARHERNLGFAGFRAFRLWLPAAVRITPGSMV